MSDSSKYYFTSRRLGFRNWSQEDLEMFANMNADPEVMEHFPKCLTRDESAESLSKARKHFEQRNYTYFATDILESGECIGFIGLYYQEYKTPFTPATDIGWRLKRSAWGFGYATEGANRCLDFAFNELNLSHVISVCTIQNIKSEKVMKKIGMQKMGGFLHPNLTAYPDYERCIWYKIEKPM